MLIDAHCHIDRFPNPAAIAANCERECITTVAVTNLPSHYRLGLSHLRGSRYVNMALGFHPLAVKQGQHELDGFIAALPKARFVGEIGLDFSREGQSSRTEQLESFRRIAEALSGTQKFVSLHSRGAAETVLRVLVEFGVKNAVFHWFSDPVAILDRAVEEGFYFSVNPAMLRSMSGQSIVSRVPRDRILTETDGPYVRIGNRPAEPGDVRGVLDYLSKKWKLSAADVERQVSENYDRIVGANV